MRRATEIAVAVIVVAGLLAAWELAVAHGWLKVYRFPPPSRIATGLVNLSTAGFPTGITVWSHTATTLERILKGYAAALAIAVPVGFLIGSSRVLDRMTAPLIVFGRSIATLSLLPLAIVWFGTGELTKIVLIGYGCFWVMLSNVIAGVKYVDPVLVRAGRAYGASGLELAWTVVLPAALPRIFTGARMALGVGFMVIVGAEMIGTIEGLGALIMEARTFYRSEITIAGMLIIGLLGFSISTGLLWLERRLVPWGDALAGVRR